MAELLVVETDQSYVFRSSIQHLLTRVEWANSTIRPSRVSQSTTRDTSTSGRSEAGQEWIDHASTIAGQQRPQLYFFPSPLPDASALAFFDYWPVQPSPVFAQNFRPGPYVNSCEGGTEETGIGENVSGMDAGWACWDVLDGWNDFAPTWSVLSSFMHCPALTIGSTIIGLDGPLSPACYDGAHPSDRMCAGGADPSDRSGNFTLLCFLPS